MKKLVFLLLICFSFGKVNAQVEGDAQYKTLMTEGLYLAMEENYVMAIQNFQKAVLIYPDNAFLHYNLGLCYLNTLNEKHKAEKHLEVAVKRVDKNCNIENPIEKTAPPLAHYYYGQALHINYNFEEELKQYESFERYIGTKDKEWVKTISRQREIANFAKEFINAPINVQIQNLGDSINGPYPDYSPVLSADERMLIYTTRRPNTTGGIKDDNGIYNEDVVVSYKDDNGNWSAPVSISPNINGTGMEAAINLTPDGQTLIIYRDGGDGMGGNIYYSTFDGKDWSPLKEFGSDVNTKYWESHACLSADGNTLIFVSNRPGGFGGRDIYRCVKLPTGAWSKALNMGNIINTEYDEDGAFIHPDGRTFFFTSNGHKTIGGFDIMFATLDENNQFSDVTNMGYPINTPDDDVFYVTSPDGRRGYFSSAKEGGLGEKDIYMVSIPDVKEKPLALFKGKIIAAEGEKVPEDLVIIVKDKATGEVIGTYRPKTTNGTFATILPPGREYTFSYQAPAGNEFYSEDVFVTNDLAYTEIKQEVALEPVKLLGKIKVKTKGMVLNALVLDNSKSKKPIENAKIIVVDESGKVSEFNSNANGKFEGIALAPGKDYKVSVEYNSIKTEPVNISTKISSEAKVFNQVLYLEKAPASQSELALDVLVRNKRKKPMANANVTLVDANGQRSEGLTDETGMLKNMALEADTKYELYATSGSNVSEKLGFNTNKLKGKQTIRKTLVISESSAITVAETTTPEGEFIFYFKYNRNKIDESADSWKNFVNKVVELSKEKPVTVDVYSSASTVPTRAYKNNKLLASSRAKKTVEKLNNAITEAGGNMSNVNFKRRSKVNGPRYKNDPRNRKKYEPHQYVKAKVY